MDSNYLPEDLVDSEYDLEHGDESLVQEDLNGEEEKKGRMKGKGKQVAEE